MYATTEKRFLTLDLRAGRIVTEWNNNLKPFQQFFSPLVWGPLQAVRMPRLRMLRDPEHVHGTHLSLSLRKSIKRLNLPVSSVAGSIARGVDPGGWGS